MEFRRKERTPVKRRDSFTRRFLQSIVASQLLLLATSAVGQTTGTWEKVDDVFPGAMANGIVADGAGNIFVAGRLTDGAGVTHAIVTKSTDQGSSWSSDPADSFTPDGGGNASFDGIAAANVSTGGSTAESHLVTAGTVNNSQWLVRRSLDAGATWLTLNLFSYSAAVTSAKAVKPAIDSVGNIYVGGTVTEQQLIKGKTTQVTHNLIRKYSGGTWKTITTTFPITRIVCVGDSLFAVGKGVESNTWQVRKSSDGGYNWVVIDTFQFGVAASPSDMAVDNSGNLLVVGYGQRTTITGKGKTQSTVSERFWITRRGTAGGTQWTNIDEFALPRALVDTGNGSYAGPYSWPYSVAVDPRNNIYVIGVGVENAEGQHWITRRLSSEIAAPKTENWTISDDFVLPNTDDFQGNCITSDYAGRVFAAGGWTSRIIGNHLWVVRRNMAP